jgi:hypothetical protein
MKHSLLERAGIKNDSAYRDRQAVKRFNVHDDRPGQIKDPNRPI